MTLKFRKSAIKFLQSADSETTTNIRQNCFPIVLHDLSDD